MILRTAIQGEEKRVRSNSYPQLVSSLPPLPLHFESEPLPITLERLQTRLRLLEPEDAEEIERLLNILEWGRQVAESTDEATVKRYDELMNEVTHPLVRELIDFGLDIRMILAALRRRRLGMGPPRVGLGRWFGHVRRRFAQPDFGLGQVLPWVVPFEQLLVHDDVLALHRRVLGEFWAWARKRSQDFDLFSFEAVVLYVARLDIMLYWHQLNVARGAAVFESLLAEAMGRYAQFQS
jgi:hypothetical protein